MAAWEVASNNTTNLWNINNALGTLRIFREDYSSTGGGANGVVALAITDGGAVTFKTQTDTAGSFNVQNAAANSVLSIDTSATAANNQVIFGKASTLDGRLLFKNATNSNGVTIVSGATAAGGGSGYTLTLPTALGASGDCIKDTTGGGVLGFGSCGGTSVSLGTYSTSNTDAHGATLSSGVLTFQDASASAPGMVGTGTQTFAGAKTFTSALTIKVDGSNVLNIQDASAHNSLTFDTTGTDANHLKIFEDTTTPTNYLDLYYDNATSSGIIKASSGTTKVGSGTGPINVTAGSSAAVTITGHAASSFTTDSGALTLTGAAASTWSTSSGTLTLQGGSGTVSLGTSTNLTAAGALTIAPAASSVLTITGHAASTWSTDSGALTLTSAAAATWSTTTGNLTLQSGGANKVIIKPGTDSTTAFQVQQAGGTAILNVDSTNNYVGINNNAPAEALDVNGNINIDSKADATAHNFASGCSCALNTAAGSFGGATGVDGVSASVIYHGKLFIATRETDGAAVYRYDGGTTWTLVTNAIGKVASGDTANIDAYVMTVYNDLLFIGTQTGTAASPTGSVGALYHSGNADTGNNTTTTWTQVNSTKGSFGMSQTTLSGISDIAVFNGTLYIATLSGSTANNLEVGRWNGLDGASAVFTQINATDGKTAAETTADAEGAVLQVYGSQLMIGAITASTTARVAAYSGVGTATTSINLTVGTFGAEASYIDVTSMAVYNGSLYVAVSKLNAASVYRWTGNTSTGTHTVGEFLRVNQTVGKLDSGDTANIDAIILRNYRGSLIAGSQGTGGGENNAGVYLYDGSQLWTLQNTTRGTFNTDANIDRVDNFISYNGTLYVGTTDGTNGVGAVYSWSKSVGQSYSLQFDSNNGNTGSLTFIGAEKSNDNQGNQGSFIFSHSLLLNSAAFDYAEDYPTFDNTLEPGDPVAVDPASPDHVRLAQKGDAILGVVSENPGMRLSTSIPLEGGDRYVPIALVGRVPAKVTTRNSSQPITAGDKLTLSDTPGVLQKATTDGEVVGTALASYSSADEGKVDVFVNPGWNGQFSGLGNKQQAEVSGLVINSGSGASAVFNVKSPDGHDVVSFDGQGNATFAGTITADKIKANQIEGLEILTNKIAALEQPKSTTSTANPTSTPDNSLTTSQPATVAAVNFNSPVTAVSLTVLADIEARGGLVVNGNAQFNGQAIFKQMAEFYGAVHFNDQVVYNNDAGGQALIKKDAAKVSINFSKEYEQTPVITANWLMSDSKDEHGNVTDSSSDKLQRLLDAGYSFTVANVTTKGFDIVLNKPAAEGLNLNWSATAIKDAKVSLSDAP